jgi:YtkA-like
MHRFFIALALAAALVAAPSAYAGGWATVGLDSTPAGVQPGDPWDVNITVLQHGRTPLEGVQPTLTIRNGDATKTFDATPTKQPGVYAVSVTFPSSGKWTYEVNDGFITQQPHTFRAVQIGEPASAPAAATTPADDGGGANFTWLLLGGVAFVLAALILLVRRHHRHEPQAA